MSTLLSRREGVKARKQYRCSFCGERIAIGELHDTRTGVVQGDGFWTMRMHPECHRYEQTPKIRRILHDWDWYEDVSEPAFPRADAVASRDNAMAEFAAEETQRGDRDQGAL